MALEKPFVLPTRALPDQDPVNFNMFATFNKQDLDKVGNNAASTIKKVEYNIVWEPNSNSQSGQTLTWRYPDQDCRDKDYSELIAKISLPLGPNT